MRYYQTDRCLHMVRREVRMSRLLGWAPWAEWAAEAEIVASIESTAAQWVWDGSGCQATPRTSSSFPPRIVSSFLSGYLNWKQKAWPRMPAKPFQTLNRSSHLRPLIQLIERVRSDFRFDTRTRDWNPFTSREDKLDKLLRRPCRC